MLSTKFTISYKKNAEIFIPTKQVWRQLHPIKQVEVKLRFKGMAILYWSDTNNFSRSNFEFWDLWQNDNHSVTAKPQTSQQGATLKSCIHNIRADSVRPV